LKGKKARQTDLVKDFGFPEPKRKELKLSKKDELEKAEKKRIDELVKAVLSLQEIANKLMPTVGKIMDAMMVQNKSIEGHSETIGVCITNQEKMVALVAEMKAEVVELQTKLGISSKPSKKTKTKPFYIS